MRRANQHTKKLLQSNQHSSVFSRLKMSLFARLRSFFGIEQIHEVRILSSVLADLCEMARTAYPKEMLAFLSATKGIQQGVLLIDELQLQAYQASNTSATMNLWQLPTVTSIVGTAHSHPSSHAHPSAADLQLFSRFGLVHAIIAYPYHPDSVRWMDKQGNVITVQIEQERLSTQ